MVPARHLTAPAPCPAPSPPSLRTAVIASAAAVGAVATGTFTALVPTPGDGTASTAAADESSVDPALAAMSMRIPSTSHAIGTLSLVSADGYAAADQHLASLGKASDIAVQLAKQLAEEKAAQAEQDRIDTIVANGGLDGWIAEALRILDLPQSYAPSVKKIIMAESGGNPRAINNWDANARRGTPSQGLMQTIPSTFRHYVAPEMAGRPITDPVANITAGLRYMIDNYGLDTVAAGGRSNSSGGYVGY
jgi:soluble lytic murein transglycosylase-like protein